jgi:predicted nucleic acid-binding protein
LIDRISPASIYHQKAINVRGQIWQAGEFAVTFSQNCYEFWAVATEPVPHGGRGLSVTEAHAELTSPQRLFPVLPDHPQLLSTWKRLVLQHACHGRVSFNARLVAGMQTHNITRIVTFNTADFARYPGLDVVDAGARVRYFAEL